MTSIKFIIVLSTLAAIALCKPASNEQLDNATVNDVSVNAVTKRQDEFIKTNEAPKKDTSIEISGISTGFDSPSTDTPTVFKPQRAGTMFARFIDDIFQIPITVLQSVAKLITNPFTTKSSPEAAAENPTH
ncbi:unnamed protein product [Brassicogethes aeneus]|uniref:Uncharacterized protein n=1 Tax=Brassicogethes aeneus TaxID=1431903 RepID=A0A9P0BFJ8_BRAAE|nr:unnamed protein product [Brassicogethes aeneus]